MEMDRLNQNLTAESAQLVKALQDRHCKSMMTKVDISADSEKRNINWVASKDFTVEVGKKQIGDYIKTWEMQPCWLCSLDFLYSTEEEHHSTFYHYRTRFSTPTTQTPIPGTASVYFAIAVFKAKQGTLSVEVAFIMESSRLVHTPGRTRFREKWLEDVIESKTLLRRAVDL